MFCSLQVKINNVVSVVLFFLYFEDQTMDDGEKKSMVNDVKGDFSNKKYIILKENNSLRLKPHTEKGKYKK